MSRRRRPYADWEVDAYVLAQQQKRHAERLASDDWEYVEDELSHVLGRILVEKQRPARQAVD